MSTTVRRTPSILLQSRANGLPPELLATLDQIRKNTSYGDLIVKQAEKLRELLAAATVGNPIVPAGPRPASRA